MNSKHFFDDFLNDEDLNIIKDTQFICVSTHIRRRDTRNDNIICLKNILYPNSTVFSKGTDEDMEYEYREQLKEEALPLLSTIIKGVIKKNYTVIFICSKKEWKLHYLEWLENFIVEYFEFPVFNYIDYRYDRYKTSYYKYDEKQILKNINKIINNHDEYIFEKRLSSVQGKKEILKTYLEMSRKELLAECKKRDCIYARTDSKEELLETLISEFDLDSLL